MARSAQKLIGRGVFDNFAGVHHKNSIGETCDHAQIVADEHQRHASFAARGAQQLHDLCLDGHIECRGRLIRDQQLRLAQQAHRQHDPLKQYPHELSGGMKQRACIAIAICLKPKVIIADEPTSALDVVVQRQVMGTLGRVQAELGAAVILVGHDIGLMAQFVDRLGIMYAGRLVEVAPIAEIITAPRHPYTRLLIDSLPSLDHKGQFVGIPGLAPLLRELPPGCAFHPRCPMAEARCRSEKPAVRAFGADISRPASGGPKRFAI